MPDEFDNKLPPLIVNNSHPLDWISDQDAGATLVGGPDTESTYGNNGIGNVLHGHGKLIGTCDCHYKYDDTIFWWEYVFSSRRV